MKRFVIYIVLLTGVLSFSQNPIEVIVDTTRIRIGEHIRYKIAVPNNYQDVQFPKLVLDSLNKVEFIEALKTDTTKTHFVQEYILTSFDSGHYVIPGQNVLINKKIYKTDSLLIDVATIEVDTLKQNLYDIKNIKEQPIVFDDYKHYIWIALLVLIIIALAIFLFLKYGRKKKENVPLEDLIPPYDFAMQRLSKLDKKQLWQNNEIKQYYIELTDILRTYIERELDVPALESTTDELIDIIVDSRKLESLQLPKSIVKDLEELLKEADLVKFAKYKPLSVAIESHRKEAEKIINSLKSTPETGDENEIVGS